MTLRQTAGRFFLSLLLGSCGSRVVLGQAPTVQQTTKGAQSPAVYAPNGKVTIQYGPSRSDINALKNELIQAISDHLEKAPTPEEAGLELEEELIRRLEEDKSRYTVASNHYKAGYELLQRREFPGAIERFTFALQGVPDFFQAQTALGIAYDRSGNASAANNAYLGAIQTARARKNQRWEAEALVRLGLMLKAKGQLIDGSSYITDGTDLADQVGYKALSALVLLANKPRQGAFRQQLFWLVDLIYVIKATEKPNLVTLASGTESMIGTLGDFLEFGEEAGLSDRLFETYLQMLRIYLKEEHTPMLAAPSELDEILWKVLPAIAASATHLAEGAPQSYLQKTDEVLNKLEVEALKRLNPKVFALMNPIATSPLPEAANSQSAAGSNPAADTGASQRNVDRLVQAYSAVVRATPSRADSYYHRGRYYLMSGKRELALADFSTAIRLDPGHAGAYFHRAIAQGFQQAFTRATQDFVKAIDLQPKWLEAFDQGFALLARYKYEEKKAEVLQQAITELNAALSIKPDATDAMSALSEAYSLNGEIDRAIELQRKAWSLRPDRAVLKKELAKSYFERSRASFAKGDEDRAILDLNTALGLWPSFGRPVSLQEPKGEGEFIYQYHYNPAAGFPIIQADVRSKLGMLEAQYYRAFLCLVLGDRKAALDAFKKVTEQDSNNSFWRDAVLTSAVVQLDMNQGREALATLDQLIARGVTDPTYAWAFFFRALVSHTLDKEELALADYSAFLDLAPESGAAKAARYWRAGIYYDKKEAETAISEYTKVIERGGYSDARLNRAQLLASQGKTEAALADYQTFIGEKEAPADVYLKTAKMLYERDDLENAWMRYSEVIKMSESPETRVDVSEAAEAYLQRGFIFFTKEKDQAALRDMKNVLRLQESGGRAANAYYLLGEISKAANESANAIENYRKALALAPNYTRAYSAALSLYHDKLFAFEEAFLLNQHWLEVHPKDFDAQMNFTESHLTSGRFKETETRVTGFLEDPGLTPSHKLVLRILEIAALLAMDRTESVPGKINVLREQFATQPEDFRLAWRFEGTKHFIEQNANLSRYRSWLIELLTASEMEERTARLAALDSVRAKFTTIARD